MLSGIKPGLTLRLERGETRSHPFVADSISFYALLLVGWSYRNNMPLHEDPNVILACRAANLDLHIEMKQFIDSATTGVTPDVIDIQSFEKIPEPDGPGLPGMKNISARLGCALFSVFAEAACDWIRLNYSTDLHSWPPVTNFARVVRNAIVHGGTINIQSATAPVVRWRGLTYSNEEYGREVINKGDLSLGDLIVLMLEMEMELNDLMAPFDLG